MQAPSQHHGQNGQDIWIGDSVALLTSTSG
jgi:hypothetical protein